MGTPSLCREAPNRPRGPALRIPSGSPPSSHRAAGLPPPLALGTVFVLAALFAQLITNYGAAALMFPITMAAAKAMQVSPEPFIFTLMVAAGSTFLTPMGYPTNLMVYGPGGYRFFDYARLGLPLTVITAVMCVLIAPVVFPFHPAP